MNKYKNTRKEPFRGEIHQALEVQFSLLSIFLILKTGSQQTDRKYIVGCRGSSSSSSSSRIYSL